MGSNPSGHGRVTNPTVLIIEDERDLARLYADMLIGDYTVETAFDGGEGLTRLGETVEVVLIDRLMPGISGDEVVKRIREEGHDCRVAVISALAPDGDVIELGFDDYLTKPISETDLHETVSALLARQQYDDRMKEYFALVSKKAVVESSEQYKATESSEFARLTEKIDALDTELSGVLTGLSVGDAMEVFRPGCADAISGSLGRSITGESAVPKNQ